MNSIISVKLDQLAESPYQGRLISKPTKRGKTDDSSLKNLMESIQSCGLMVPIQVRKLGSFYQIVDGHRRVEAFERLGIKEIDAIIKDCDDNKAQIYSVVVNLMRKNLSIIEKALAFKKILQAEDLTQHELAHAIGKDDTFISDILNTLEMDQRIIDDLVPNKTTADVRLLRAIIAKWIFQEHGLNLHN
ncbi:ParB/RepB/Spo0J family partition protein [bacterium]|nr:MAG: ParB/RepB/Spo0J family partition protein [bacterium]